MLMLQRMSAILTLAGVGLVQTAGLPADRPRPAPGGEWRASVREFARENAGMRRVDDDEPVEIIRMRHGKSPGYGAAPIVGH